MHSYRHDIPFHRQLILALFAAFACVSAVAEETGSWRDQPYAYRVIDQDVRGVLSEFGRNLGMPVIVSKGVDGKVRGDIFAATAGEFLSRIGSTNGLLWYQDGTALIVDRESDLTHRNFDVRGVDTDALRQSLAGLSDGASPLISSEIRSDGSLSVSGPPSYLDRVGQRVGSLRPIQRTATRPTESGVRVFRGGAQTEVVSN